MSWLLLLAAAIAGWLWETGRYRSIRWQDAAAVVVALLALRLMTRGEWLPGMIGLGFAGGWLWYGRRGALTRRVRGTAMTAEEARAVLQLPPAADAAMIRDAHRRLIVRVHPDAGGSAELARRVNVARDVLLGDLNRTRPRAS